MYAGINTRFTKFSGVYKSIDGGATWDALDLGIATWIQAAAIAVNPQLSNTLYTGIDAGPDNSGVYKSTDGGENWARTGLMNSVTALVIDPATPNTLYATVSGPTPGEMLYKTVDGGLNWINLSNGLPAGFISSALAIDPNQPQTLYISESSLVGIYKSTDGGNIWKEVNNGLTHKDITDLVVVPGSPNTVFAGTRAGVFISTNGGDSWTAVNTGLTQPTISKLAVDPLSSIYLYAGTYSGGVFKSNFTIEEETDSGDGDGGDGRCFIATAAYGSYLHKDVMVLREFRDDFLLTNTLGKKIVTLYYEYSPPIAAYIAQHEVIKSVTRWLLTPLVMTIKYPFGALIVCMIVIVGIPAIRLLRQA